MNKRFSIAIHGGAGVISKDIDHETKDKYLQGLKDSLKVGMKLLASGESALEAVTQTVVALENNKLFNAGIGAVYNCNGDHELDASIMDGASLKCAAAACVTKVKNPILLVHNLINNSSPIFLAGDGANLWAKKIGLEMVENSYFNTEHRKRQLENAMKKNIVALDHSKGTVGAVAIDQHGNLASATSTGGMTNKVIGRVGDSGVIGAGTYANNETCAISCTGSGEQYIKHVVAHTIHALMKYKGMSLSDASNYIVSQVLSPDDGGLIGIDYMGNIVMPFNTPGMFRASYSSSDDQLFVGIW